MFVARSFSYGKRKGDKDEKAMIRDAKETRPTNTPNDGQIEHRGFGWRPESFSKHQESMTRVAEARRRSGDTRRRGSDTPTIRAVGSPNPPQTASRPTPSRPVAVPSRSHDRYQHPQRAAPQTRSEGARSSMSSPVANILAQTSIPARKTFPRTRRKPETPQRISIDEVVDEWNQADFEHGTPPGVSPAMDALLSPPEEADLRLGHSSSDDDIPGSSRSTSSDSMPSLERSESTSTMAWSLPSTPETSFRNSLRKGSMASSSPKSVDSSSDHPLLPLPTVVEPESEREDNESNGLTPKPKRSPSRTSLPASSASMRKASQQRSPSQGRSLKSNLTASISSLRNNLSRTFSNFSAPSSEDIVTRSLLGAPYHPEMRPRLSGPPSAEMRRYLNPHAFQLYDFHLHNSYIDDADLEVVAAANAAGAEARAIGDPSAPAAPDADVIPMNTYVRRKGSRKGAATEAGRAMLRGDGKTPQQRREPRENPDFLRIAVLEMQMRRAGKTEGPTNGGMASSGPLPGIGATGTGRRAWFLPPRPDAISHHGGKTKKRSKRRWVAVTP